MSVAQTELFGGGCPEHNPVKSCRNCSDCGGLTKQRTGAGQRSVTAKVSTTEDVLAAHSTDREYQIDSQRERGGFFFSF